MTKKLEEFFNVDANDIHTPQESYATKENENVDVNEAKNEVNVDVLSLKYLLTENPWIIFSQAVTASRPMQDLFQRVVEKNQR